MWGVYVPMYVCIHTHTKWNIYYSAICDMDFEGIILGEVSQTQKDKYCMVSLTCGI